MKRAEMKPNQTRAESSDSMPFPTFAHAIEMDAIKAALCIANPQANMVYILSLIVVLLYRISLSSGDSKIVRSPLSFATYDTHTHTVALRIHTLKIAADRLRFQLVDFVFQYLSIQLIIYYRPEIRKRDFLRPDY